MVKLLAQTCPVTRTSPNAAPVYDILQSFFLTALRDGKRFAHVNRLREDPTINSLFEVTRVVSDDTIRRFFRQIDETQGKEWVSRCSQMLWGALPDLIIQHWDSTVLTKNGHQEGAEVWYNPHKKGRKSFHPLVATVAGTRLCTYYRWRPGNVSTAHEVVKAMEESQQWLGKRQVWLNRGDKGFASEQIFAWHEEPGHKRTFYLMKLKMTANVKRALASVSEEEWEGPHSRGVLQLVERTLCLDNWSCGRRVILGRRYQGQVSAESLMEFWDKTKYEVEAYVTHLPFEQVNSWQIVNLYRKRGDAENVFDELKNQWGFDGFCSQNANVTSIASRLILLTYNLWNLFCRFMEPARHVEAREGGWWFLSIAGRLQVRSRQKTFEISVQSQWWEDLSAGYQRLKKWLELTAQQLRREEETPPEWVLKAVQLIDQMQPNCGI